MHDVNVLDLLLPKAGAYYVIIQGHLDFERLYYLHVARSFFVTPSAIANPNRVLPSDRTGHATRSKSMIR